MSRNELKMVVSLEFFNVFACSSTCNCKSALRRSLYADASASTSLMSLFSLSILLMESLRE